MVTALALSACGGTESPAGTPTPTQSAAPEPSESPSPSATAEAEAADEPLAWQEGRPPKLKQIIDEDTAAANCEGLQAAFDNWEGADDPTNTSSDLLTYIDAGMQEAGCY